MRRFIECLIPVTACNLKCSYCYVIQEGRRKNEKALFQYAPEIIAKGLSVERLGGVSLISITGSGETLIPNELPAIVSGILKEGHFVNITTNGTLSKQLNKLLDATENYHSHLHFSFSLHYVELMNKHLLDAFFLNVKKVRDSGCSILVQINLSDEYVPYWQEIKDICKKNVGAYPQVALTRDESNKTYKIMSKTMNESEYKAKGMEMSSPLFDFTCRNFMVKRKEYCYAGLWSAKLNLCTGEMTGCYGHGFRQNIFENISEPIRFRPIGHHCPFKYCFNSSHFISQGIIPELIPVESYGELRNREKADWYEEEMKSFLYEQFEKTNPLLNRKQKMYFEIIHYMNVIKKYCKIIYQRLS